MKQVFDPNGILNPGKIFLVGKNSMPVLFLFRKKNIPFKAWRRTGNRNPSAETKVKFIIKCDASFTGQFCSVCRN
ncbi:MAG: hypothetical protein V5804_10490 [Mucilaginibacter sp.]|uniref:hypothetical protein n=1 Tax=Mucilaginibacter sp. TaxID=1882438 RepID=UPI0034E45DCB